MKAEIKVEQPADESSTLMLKEHHDTKAPQTQESFAPYNFECFNCSEMFESIIDKFASSQLTCIQMQDVRADVITSFETKKIVLANSKTGN